MPYYEHLEGREYRLRTVDPNRSGRKWISERVEVPDDVVRSERKTKLWLDLQLAKFDEKVQSGELIRPEKATLSQFLPTWKQSWAKQRMGDYTVKNTLAVINAHLIPEFGSERMDKIKTLHLVTYFSRLKRKDGKPMATNTKLNIYKAAKSLFDAAAQWKLIATNPMNGVDKPTPDKHEKREIRKRKKAYHQSEAEAVIKALYGEPDRWRLYFIGVLLGGFRRGEYLAVEWHQVNFDTCGIYVEKQITFDEEGKTIEGELKTEESEAYVTMPRWYMDELRAFKREWNKEKLICKDWNGGNKQYLFHAGKGEMYYPNTPSFTWRKFLDKHQLPRVRLHDLRHTTAMILREKGAQTKTIQERLRHARASTTEDIYMHETPLVSREAADHLEELNPFAQKSAPKTAPESNA